MKVYSERTHEQTHAYIGEWYDGQCFPQPLYLLVEGREQTVDITEGACGGGCSSAVFNNLDLRFELPCSVLSFDEAEQLIKDLQPDIDALLATYEEYYDGNNYAGRWGEDEIDILERVIDNLGFESDLFFDDQGFMEPEEELEEVQSC